MRGWGGGTKTYLDVSLVQKLSSKASTSRRENECKERFDTAYIYRILHLSLIGACSLEEDKIGVRPVAAWGHLMHAVVVDQLLAAVGDFVPVLENVERRREHGEVI